MSVISLSVCEPMKIAENTAKDPLILLPILLALGVITFVLPYFLYTLGMRDLPAGTASALGIVEPMTASLLGIFIFNEEITVFSGIGIVMILASVMMLSFADNEKQKIKVENHKIEGEK
jgi:drug/metabolite transporter (DMT)-like permease